MSDKLVERIQEEIKKLQDQRAEWNKTIGHYQLQIDNLTKQYAFLGVLEGSLKSLLAPTVGEVVKPTLPTSTVPQMPTFSEIFVAQCKALHGAPLCDYVVAVLARSDLKSGASIRFIADKVRELGYATKSKVFGKAIHACLNHKSNNKLFKRLEKGVYTVYGNARKGKA